MINLNHKKFLTILSLSIFTLFPLVTSADEVRLEASRVEVRTGEQFIITAIMSSGEPVNAVEGRLVFPQETLSVKAIREGDSVINFWVEKPHVESAGSILFSGITPGGIKGVNSHIFSVVFEAKKTGLASINFQNIKALKNDGLGTEIALTNRNVVVSIKLGDGSVYKEVVIDTEPPEEFDLNIENNQNMFGGKYFLVFSTQDKGSGVAHYEKREYRFKPLSFFSWWKNVDSPALLKDQKLKSTVIIRATDNYRNVRLSEIKPKYPLAWYESLLYWGIIIISLMAIYIIIFKIIKRIH